MNDVYSILRYYSLFPSMHNSNNCNDKQDREAMHRSKNSASETQIIGCILAHHNSLEQVDEGIAQKGMALGSDKNLFE